MGAAEVAVIATIAAGGALVVYVTEPRRRRADQARLAALKPLVGQHIAIHIGDKGIERFSGTLDRVDPNLGSFVFTTDKGHVKTHLLKQLRGVEDTNGQLTDFL